MKDATEYLIEELEKRREFGYNKYGKFLDTDTEVDMIRAAWEESIDKTLYLGNLLKQIEEGVIIIVHANK